MHFPHPHTDARPSAAPLDVATALQESAVRFEASAARKNLALVFQLHSDLPPVGFDVQPFDRVLRRLLDNALRFTPEGGQVTVTAEPAANPGAAPGEPPGLRLVVADTGLGLKPEDCERIFEPCVQLEPSYLQHSEGVGVGLGLTLARRQVEHYGGRLWAESAGPGQGSTFTLWVPAVGAPPAAPTPP